MEWRVWLYLAVMFHRISRNWAISILLWSWGPRRRTLNGSISFLTKNNMTHRTGRISSKGYSGHEPKVYRALRARHSSFSFHEYQELEHMLQDGKAECIMLHRNENFDPVWRLLKNGAPAVDGKRGAQTRHPAAPNIDPTRIKPTVRKPPGYSAREGLSVQSGTAAPQKAPQIVRNQDDNPVRRSDSR